MQLNLQNLPTDSALLQTLVRDIAGVLADRDDEIERLRHIIRRFKRAQFGRRSERLSEDQLALGLEDLETDLTQAIERPRPTPKKQTAPEPSRPRREPLPANLPRVEKPIDIQHTACPCCGGALHAIGESVSEMLDWVPATVQVLKIRRPKYGCRGCGSIQ